MAVDLHLHSSASDGTLTPADIVKRAHAQGLSAIALTDHDTVAGIEEALKTGDDLGITVIPGLEMSSEYGGKDVHILGYFIDCSSPRLLETLTVLRESRLQRAQTMVDKLAGLGLEIDYGEVCSLTQGGAIGRPHVAQILVRHGLVKDIGSAFELYIGRDGPGYVAKYVLNPADVIGLIHQAGGVTSLAHPGLSRVGEELLLALKAQGLDAVEVWHTDHSDAERDTYLELATRVGLLVTGGSDCHGFGKIRGYVLGSIDIPDTIIGPLKERAGHASLT